MSRGPEGTLQDTVIKYLKTKGCVVLKVPASPGVPKGFPDVLALKEGLWLAIEVKASKSSKFQPGQQAMLKKLGEWSYAYVAYGGKNSNWPKLKLELDSILL